MRLKIAAVLLAAVCVGSSVVLACSNERASASSNAWNLSTRHTTSLATTSAGQRGSLGNVGGYPFDGASDCSATYGAYSWCVNGSEWDYTYGGYGYRNCTDYVAWYLVTQEGVPVSSVRGLGHAKDWKAGAGRPGNAQVGAVAWWGGGLFGHVAIVTAVNADGSVNVAEYNHYGNGTFSQRSGVRPDGFIDF